MGHLLGGASLSTSQMPPEYIYLIEVSQNISTLIGVACEIKVNFAGQHSQSLYYTA